MSKTKTTKKRTVGAPGEVADQHSQENFNQLYTAHQVHTLAQIVYQRLTQQCAAPGHVAPTMNVGFQPSFQGPQPGMLWSAPGMTAAVRGVGQIPAPAMFYWYP